MSARIVRGIGGPVDAVDPIHAVDPGEDYVGVIHVSRGLKSGKLDAVYLTEDELLDLASSALRALRHNRRRERGLLP